MGRAILESVLDPSMNKSVWVDGLQNKVFLHVKAFPEILTFLQDMHLSDDLEDPDNVMNAFLVEIIHLHDEFNMLGAFECDNDSQKWNFIQQHMLYDDDNRHIPIPVYSYIKPTMGPRFIHHIMLSLGEFDTEVDLILHRTLRESLRYCKLIGPLDDDESLKKYSGIFLNKYIEDQLVYFPNSDNVLDQWIVTAGDLFDSVILRNEIPITDMPPCHQAALNDSKDEAVLGTWEK